MTLKITDSLLSIPPYLSTTWEHIASLYMKGGILAVTLEDGESIHIPNLTPETIQLIFRQHALYLDRKVTAHTQQSASEAPSAGEATIRFAFGQSLEGLEHVMQHNPHQSNAPDLPHHVIQKISAIARIMGPTEIDNLPAPVPHCNCFYCQIARSFQHDSPPPCADEERGEHVEEKELQFQQWTITQIGEQLFLVVNRLDPNEKYQVFLGEPVGCTCGKGGCEHILSVLKS